jgi:CheY-like chemotaxis protein
MSGTATADVTVLLVDDDPTAHELLTAALGREGYRLIHAGNGEEALALAREIRPDAITLDVLMPRLDGWAVLAALKADAELCDIPVVVVTMLPDRGIALSLGAEEFVTKPVDRARLAALLRRLVRHEGNVLLVEDDPASRALARHTVERLGLTAIEAENGRVALEWLAAHPPPDLVLLDLMMPELDGFGFLDAFRAREAWRRIPVIVLTAKQLTPEERERLAGATRQVIAKAGANARDVAAAVRAAVRQRRVDAAAEVGG